MTAEPLNKGNATILQTFYYFYLILLKKTKIQHFLFHYNYLHKKISPTWIEISTKIWKKVTKTKGNVYSFAFWGNFTQKLSCKMEKLSGVLLDSVESSRRRGTVDGNLRDFLLHRMELPTNLAAASQPAFLAVGGWDTMSGQSERPWPGGGEVIGRP